MVGLIVSVVVVMLGGMTRQDLSPDVQAFSEVALVRAGLESLAPTGSEVESVDRIRALEELKAVCAALQAEETAVLQQRRLAAEAARGVAAARRGKGLAAEIGLARQASPNRGSQYLGLAEALTTDLPKTRAALRAGRIREEHAQVVVSQTSWLQPADRQQVDALLAEQLGAIGVRKLEARARGHAQRLDQAGAVHRLAKAQGERRVSVRPAPENMAYLTALLSMQQAVGVLAALQRDATTMVGTGDTADPADPTCTPRTRDQIMADLLVQRTTGQVTAAAVPAEVQVVMTDTALFGDDATPAWLTGHGPIPARVAKHWLADPAMKVFLRRVFTRPHDRQLVAMDSRARLFPSGLRRMVTTRDDRCRAPFCDAPIRDIDHMDPAAEGGPTSYQNASGLCARCNQIKQHNQWRHTGDPEQLTVTTPTGHAYTTPTTSVPPGTPPPNTRCHRPPPDQNRHGPPPQGTDPPQLRITDLHDYRHPELTITHRVA